MAALNITLLFDGDDPDEQEREFLNELRAFLKGRPYKSGNFYGDYVGHYMLKPYRKIVPPTFEPLVDEEG